MGSIFDLLVRRGYGLQLLDAGGVLYAMTAGTLPFSEPAPAATDQFEAEDLARTALARIDRLADRIRQTEEALNSNKKRNADRLSDFAALHNALADLVAQQHDETNERLAALEAVGRGETDDDVDRLAEALSQLEAASAATDQPQANARPDAINRRTLQYEVHPPGRVDALADRIDALTVRVNNHGETIARRLYALDQRTADNAETIKRNHGETVSFAASVGDTDRELKACLADLRRDLETLANQNAAPGWLATSARVDTIAERLDRLGGLITAPAVIESMLGRIVGLEQTAADYCDHIAGINRRLDCLEGTTANFAEDGFDARDFDALTRNVSARMAERLAEIAAKP